MCALPQIAKLITLMQMCMHWSTAHLPTSWHWWFFWDTLFRVKQFCVTQTYCREAPILFIRPWLSYLNMNMPQTNNIDSAKAERAAFILLKHDAPFLIVKLAILAAKFLSEQASLKSMQRNVRWSLPDRRKHNSIAILTSWEIEQITHFFSHFKGGNYSNRWYSVIAVAWVVTQSRAHPYSVSILNRFFLINLSRSIEL